MAARAPASGGRAAGGRGGGGSAGSRQDAIREILASRTVGTQDDLQRQLAARGIVAAQATVSRDLVQLGVTRVGTAAGPRYSIPGDGGALPLGPVRMLVDSVRTNGVLVVVRTKSSAASTVARAIDDAGVPDVLGSLAGDDTIFIAPTRPRATPALARRLRRLLGV